MPRKPQRGKRRGRGGKPKAYVDLIIGGVACQRSKTFDVGTSDDVIEEWRAAMKRKFKGQGPCVPGSFGELVEDYKPMVSAKKTFKQIAAHLAEWVALLGRDRRPETITKADINVAQNQMLTTPTNQPDPAIRGRRGRPTSAKGQNPATVKKKRGTLRRMFNVLNGADGFNPARGSVCPVVGDYDDVRGIDPRDAMRIVAAMPLWCWIRKGIKVLSKARVRAEVMIWTGLPPHLLMLVKLRHLALDAPVPYVMVARRLKGKGVRAAPVKLSAQAVEAFRRFIAANAFGDFAPESFNRSVKAAVKRSGVVVPENFHAYDLRHTFGSALASVGVEDAAIGRLMIHAEGSTMSRRYTQAAHAKVDDAAVAALGQAFVPVVPVSPSTLPKPAQEPARVRKSHNRGRLSRVS